MAISTNIKWAIVVTAVLVSGAPRPARAQTEAPEVPETARPHAATKGAPATIERPPAPAESPPRPTDAPTEIPSDTAPPVHSASAQAAPGDARSAEAVVVAAPASPARAPAWSLTPGARLAVDGGVFHDGPSAALLVRRARVQVTGWIAPWIYLSAAADYAAPPGLPSVFAPTDVFLAASPLGPLLTLQAGQFDAPFTLENRTVDDTTDFLERSIAIRAFAIPENKATGAMLTGTDETRRFHYALGVFDADSPALRSNDGQFDFMARAWLAPFAFAGDSPLRDVSLGGSFWIGDRANATPLAPQTTAGGFAFARFPPYTTSAGGAPRQLRQIGRRVEAAGELEAPLGPRYGARAEVVWRRSPLSEEDVTDPARPTILGGANLQGWAAYGQAWFWVFGDDRSAPIARHGLEPFVPRVPDAAAPDGLMLAARVSHLDEEVWHETDAALLNLRDPAVGVTVVTSYELGINYWHARAFRASCNYVINRISGTTAEVTSLGVSTEQELLFRLAITL